MDPGAADWTDEPTGPDDRTIATDQGTVGEPSSWLAFVRDQLTQPGGYITVSSGPSELYAQAANLDDTLVLEYRDGGPDRHFQTTGVSFDEVATALSQWFRGERTFIGEHVWQLVEL
jgi:hypothetical protein